MPTLQVQTNVPLEGDAIDRFFAAATDVVATALGKPPSFVQVSLTTTAMSFAGTTAPTAFVLLTSLGKVEEAAPVASRALADLLTAHLGVQPGRAYIQFFDCPRHMMALNGTPFG
ncbi:hypothetical protein MMPV_005533 [Pyropia vietnamensis]